MQSDMNMCDVAMLEKDGNLEAQLLRSLCCARLLGPVLLSSFGFRPGYTGWSTFADLCNYQY